MTDIDLLDLLAQELGFAQGKGCFLCPTNRILQKPFSSDVCSSKEFFKLRATADRHYYLAYVKRGGR